MKHPGNLEFALMQLLNEYSVENDNDTPDFILAEYITDALTAYQRAVRRRDRWYNIDPLTDKPKKFAPITRN